MPSAKEIGGKQIDTLKGNYIFRTPTKTTILNEENKDYLNVGKKLNKDFKTNW